MKALVLVPQNATNMRSLHTRTRTAIDTDTVGKDRGKIHNADTKIL